MDNALVLRPTVGNSTLPPTCRALPRRQEPGVPTSSPSRQRLSSARIARYPRIPSPYYDDYMNKEKIEVPCLVMDLSVPARSVFTYSDEREERHEVSL